jgi:hypothetical protein
MNKNINFIKIIKNILKNSLCNKLYKDEDEQDHKCDINCLCNNKNNCYLIENFNILLNEIPDELKNLRYGVYPNDNKYNDNRFIYNKLFNYFPHAIFYPTNINDVSYLIKNFVNYNLEFAIQCGGHSYEPASLSFGYIINVSKLSHYVNIDKNKKSVKISSGLKLGYLIDSLSKESVITPTGDASCVGISGLSLAGGKGNLTRLYGMVCDNILSVKIINYKGEIMNVNTENCSDLYWAIKGAGNCNFGVITEIELKIYDDIYCQFETLQWNWDPKHVFIIYKLYQKWILTIPKTISGNFNITYNNGTAIFSIKFIKFNKEPFIEIDEFKKLFSPTITYCSGYYSKITDCWVSYETGDNNIFSKIKSTMIFKPINDKSINILIDSVNKLLISQYELNYQLNFIQLGGEVKNGNSSYFPKNAIMVLSIFINWSNNILDNYSIKFVNNIYSDIKEYTSDYCFPNFIDYDIENYMHSYYGNNSDKLIDVKKKYDPNNIFRYKQSIPIL